MKVYGIQRNVVIDFYDNKKSKQVHLEGVYLHLGETKPDVEGIAVMKPLFVSNEKPCFKFVEDLKVGDEVTVYYNRFGTFEAVGAK